MRAFHMNLLNYNANTMFPLNGNQTPKHTRIQDELNNYRNNVMGQQNNVDVAGFTEVFVATGANPNNVINALGNLGDALGIPRVGGNHQIAVVRCGFTALQPNGNEVVAIVLNGNAIIANYYIAAYCPPQAVQPGWHETTIVAAQAGYTSHLVQEPYMVADYRYIVGVEFSLGGTNYDIAFIHNRQPGAEQGTVMMGQIRNYLGQATNANMLLGGDFNLDPLCQNANPCSSGAGANARWYYSNGATTAADNPRDWWISANQFLNGQQPAQCNVTPTMPNPNTTGTGTDHRGIGITIN
ncbi:hypothetical protein H6F96_21905 [Microcoleus sp. FACHB-53]|nr:hypothetical protein [Microcoleus sp. FACHB-53]